jgi:hypothetical protein
MYLTSSYYDGWLTGAESVLVESGALDRSELDRVLAHPLGIGASPRYEQGKRGKIVRHVGAPEAVRTSLTRSGD